MAALGIKATTATFDGGASRTGTTEADPRTRTQPEHREFLGLPFCLLSLEETSRLIFASCQGPYAYVVTPNAHHVVTVNERSDALLPIYRQAWLSLCDSQIIRGLAALDGVKLPIARGSDLIVDLLAQENSTDGRGTRFLVVGPDSGTRRALRTRYQRAHIEVLPAPDGLARRPDLRLAVAQACVRRPWDILILCVGCPAQEMIAALIAELGRRSGVALCAGAAIDFASGRSRRAPRWLQSLGLEWAYRLAREPGRLWRRYLVESPRIVALFLRTRLFR